MFCLIVPDLLADGYPTFITAMERRAHLALVGGETAGIADLAHRTQTSIVLGS
jgi:hypothetical protein